MYHLRVPKTDQELESYFHFRWAMLRKPLNQPQGSEKDGYDTYAHHQMVVDETRAACGCRPFVYQCRK